MKSEMKKGNKSSINDLLIKEFLLVNPNYLVDNPDILNALNITHESGIAVSLIQKQVELLRSDLHIANEKLRSLINIAKTNESLLEVSKKLTLDLLSTRDISMVIQILETTFISELDATQCKVYFFSPIKSKKLPLGRIKDELFANYIEELLKSRDKFYGDLDKESMYKIFEPTPDIKEVILIKLNCISTSGVVAIGSNVKGKYDATKATTFLDFIIRILSKIIDRENI